METTRRTRDSVTLAASVTLSLLGSTQLPYQHTVAMTLLLERPISQSTRRALVRIRRPPTGNGTKHSRGDTIRECFKFECFHTRVMRRHWHRHLGSLSTLFLLVNWVLRERKLTWLALPDCDSEERWRLKPRNFQDGRQRQTASSPHAKEFLSERCLLPSSSTHQPCA